MTENDWIFTEDQRDSVCKGELCPKCLSTKVQATGAVPDGINMNMAFRCEDCDSFWEGY